MKKIESTVEMDANIAYKKVATFPLILHTNQTLLPDLS
jgi:hypothetical protein